ncbi:TPA: single-stranded-DNA-specific exonuclease RecJ, partial [Clostridioides difficile]|nr:single-stranded-DNA-specific exonuclease RecJ [Clostridioides difficile]
LQENVINLNLVEELHKLEPFGLNNPNPRFIVRNYILKDLKVIGKNQQHLKLSIEKEKSYECIGFNMSHLKSMYKVGDKVDVLFQLDENNYMGNRKVQFLLKDIRLARPKSASNDKLSLKLMSKIIPKDTQSLYNISVSDFELFDGNTDINIFDYFEKDTLIISNSINGFYRAMSDISLIDLDFNINYNIIEDVSKNTDKLELIFSPNIDKIDLKRYNNIILYDYLYNKGEYSYIYENKREESEIIKYYNKTDLLYLKNVVSNIVPSRDEFITIYKQALIKKEIDLDMVNIRETFNVIPLKFFTILNVFRELNLLDFNLNYEKNSVLIRILPKPQKKLDLNESLILNNLKNLEKQYNSSY